MGNKIPVVSIKESSAKIVLLSDVHWGQKACSKERFLKTLDYISRGKSVYCILGGDLVEMVTRSQKGNMLLEQDITPTDQILQMTELLKPLVVKGKILGILRDNHLQRCERDALLDMNEIFASNLNIPYWGVGGIIRVVIGNKPHRIAYQHGADASINEFMKLEQMMRIYPGCDLYALGHNHKLSSRKVVTIGVDALGEECGREHWQVRTGSYLRFAQYAREKLFAPSVIGSPIVCFDSGGKITIDIDTLSWSH